MSRKRIQKPVFGLETEYASFVEVQGPEGEMHLRPADEHRLFPTHRSTDTFAPSRLISVLDGFLLNGGRFYSDSNDHLEYATPEADNLDDLIACERAGDAIVEEFRADFSARTGLRFRVFKNNLALAEPGQWDRIRTYGAHENYLVLRREETDPEALARCLVPFLITRVFAAGNGWLGRREDGTLSFELSQRLKEMRRFVEEDVTKTRPFILKRDEAHADSGRFRRAHLMCGDSLMAQSARYFQFGSTALLLEMISNGSMSRAPVADFNEFEALNSAREFNGDSSLRKTATFGGEAMRITEVQRRYFEEAHRYWEQYRKGGPYDGAMKRWGSLLNAAESNAAEPHMALAKKCDWAAKKMLMERVAQKNGWDLARPVSDDIFYRLKQYDLLFHEIGPDSIARRFERRGALETRVEERRVRRRMRYAPETTRAACRVRALEHAASLLPGFRRLYGNVWMQGSWDHVRIMYGNVPLWVWENPDPSIRRFDGGFLV